MSPNVALASVKAAVFDPQASAFLYQKNADIPTSIASVTKMMTAMVVLDGGQSLDELLAIEKVNRDGDNNGYSRMRIGSRLARGNPL